MHLLQEIDDLSDCEDMHPHFISLLSQKQYIKVARPSINNDQPRIAQTLGMGPAIITSLTRGNSATHRPVVAKTDTNDAPLSTPSIKADIRPKLMEPTTLSTPERYVPMDRITQPTMMAPDRLETTWKAPYESTTALVANDRFCPLTN
ncbi:hypothetical protein CWM47_09735 [Spirosoma pollinicola]|uniref:Uncharacterized protein n=1 Tax=Spirosoma pollinicola TaxID=2057025 RepID=A0A2K8YWR7_9BACT|nr:hypothetical protein CWM47_09735 [Spirosoma pollinicola]